MKEFEYSEAEASKAETAILVGLVTPTQDEAKTTEYLDELEFLADTAGAVIVKRFTQKVGGPNQTSYVGKGKLEEIHQYIKDEEDNDREIGMVIFDDELSAKQLRNIENELHVKVLDRTSLTLYTNSLHLLPKPYSLVRCRRRRGRSGSRVASCLLTLHLL